MNNVKLRAMEPEDLDFLYTIENDIERWDAGTTHAPYSRYLLHDYMANASGDIYTDKQVRLVVETEDGTAVGLADITAFSPTDQRAELSIIIQKCHRRQGYAYSALSQMVSYARNVFHLHQLYAIIADTNTPSLCLYEKMGFAQTATLKHWLYDGKKYYNAKVLQLFL